MRKIILAIAIVGLIAGQVFAETRSLGDKPLVDWEFSPEVGTKAGYNLDSKSFGLSGTTQLNLESTIHAKANQEFTGEGTMYGKIVVNDLEIKVSTGDNGSGYEGGVAANATNAGLLKVTWGDIEGTVFIGPAYIKLANTGHGEVRYVDTIADGDLDFSVIAYSVIPPHYTGSRKGRVSEAVGSVGDGSVIAGDAQYINNSFAEYSLSSIAFGVDTEMIDFEVGFSTQRDYLQRVGNVEGDNEDTDTYYNPFEISATVGVKATEELSVNLKADAQSGQNAADFGFMTENNPLTVGTSATYKTKVAGFGLTPVLAAEIQAENKRTVSSVVNTGISWNNDLNSFVGNPAHFTALFDENNEPELRLSYEVALGVTLDWADKGIEKTEKDALSYADEDLNVKDGVSLGVLYGQAPQDLITSLSTSYIGVQIGMWDSEDGDAVGMIPGVQTSLVANINYVLGSTDDIKDIVNGAKLEITNYNADRYSKYELAYDPRMDIGVGFEAKYTKMNVQPYIGALFKWFNVMDGGAKVTVDDTETKYSEVMINQQDLRMKLGFDIKNVIANTTINVGWTSGDLLENGDKFDNEARGTFNDYDYFENEASEAAGNTLASFDSQAIAGYISAGLTISF